MTKEEKMIVEYETDHGSVKLSPGIVRRFLTQGNATVSDQEVVLFINLCRYQQLNPFLREAYLIKYSDNKPATMVVGKDTFIKRAAKHSQYDGSKAGIYVQKNKEIEKRIGTLLLPGENLVGGWAEVYRKDWHHPVEISVSYHEYEQKKNNGEVNRQWSRMPATMIRKVALAQALREAFPDQFQGMYDSAEVNSEIEGEVNYQTTRTEHFENYTIEKDEPVEKSSEYKKIEEEILKTIEDPGFSGLIVLDGHEADLDYYKKEIKNRLSKKIYTMEKLQQTAETIKRMLETALNKPKDELFENEEMKYEGNLSVGGK